MKLSTITLLALSLGVPSIAFAQEKPYTLLAPLPVVGNQVTDLGPYLSGMFTIGLGLAVAFAVLVITWGGFQYIWSATPGGKGDGLEKMNNALLGLLLAFGSWLFLYTINPNLVKFDFSLKSLGLKVQTPVAPLAPIDRSQDYVGYARINKEQADLQKKQDELARLPADDPSRASKLDAVAEADKKLILDRANTSSAVDLNYAYQRIEGVQGFRKDEPFVRDTIGSSVAKITQDYNDAMNEFKKKYPNDLEGINNMLQNKNYLVATVQTETLARYEIKNASQTAQTLADKAVLNEQLQRILDEIKQKDADSLRFIRDPELNGKFVIESADRIKRLEALKRK